VVRPTQLLHPQRRPAPTRLAATVLLLRDGQQGLEVLMTRRSATASFAPGAFVFPGGAVDPADADAAVHARATRRPGQPDASLTWALAAIRECFEELGVLLACDANGSDPAADAIGRLDRRADADRFYASLAALGLRPAADRVRVLARWITDRDLPRRFDVPFLVAPMPGDQVPRADEAEQFEPVWVNPADALARHAAGQFFMIYPTIRTLERLRPHYTVAEVMAACASETPLWTSCPRAGMINGREERWMEDEPPYGELELVSPDGQIVHRLDWRHDAPVTLLRNLQRLTCPNPGPMTGPGTNSYLVGTPDSGHIVIDPGPDDPEHLLRLWRAAGGDIRAIVCTHSHPDHAPGARPLQSLVAARGRPSPQVLGLPSGPQARAGSRFVPDRALTDGERLVLTEPAADGAAHTLRVIHTPGHASNHLCLWLEEDGLLFTGDHILNGSTTVIDPPDGDMTAYLESLDRLASLCERRDGDRTVDPPEPSSPPPGQPAPVRYLLPAHGHVLAPAAAAIARLKAHRQAREARVLDAMRRLPAGSPRDWLALAYADVPERMWPVAERSLLAHVQRIEALGLMA